MSGYSLNPEEFHAVTEVIAELKSNYDIACINQMDEAPAFEKIISKIEENLNKNVLTIGDLSVGAIDYLIDHLDNRGVPALINALVGYLAILLTPEENDHTQQALSSSCILQKQSTAGSFHPLIDDKEGGDMQALSSYRCMLQKLSAVAGPPLPVISVYSSNPPIDFDVPSVKRDDENDRDGLEELQRILNEESDVLDVKDHERELSPSPSLEDDSADFSSAEPMRRPSSSL